MFKWNAYAVLNADVRWESISVCLSVSQRYQNKSPASDILAKQGKKLLAD